jgi:hypothetical protein
MVKSSCWGLARWSEEAERSDVPQIVKKCHKDSEESE